MKIDPKFWADMALRFTKLHDERNPIEAAFNPNGWNAQSPNNWNAPGDSGERLLDSNSPWILSGGTPQIVDEFKSLAEVAAIALGCEDKPELWRCWLDHLRRHSIDYSEEWEIESASSGPTSLVLDAKEWPVQPTKRLVLEADKFPNVESGTTNETIRTGDIQSACEASARFCRKLTNECEKAEMISVRQSTVSRKDPIAADAAPGHGVDELEPLVSVQKAAKLLSVSEDTVRRMQDDQRIKLVRIGKQRRVRKSDLKRLLITENYPKRRV